MFTRRRECHFTKLQNRRAVQRPKLNGRGTHGCPRKKRGQYLPKRRVGVLPPISAPQSFFNSRFEGRMMTITIYRDRPTSLRRPRTISITCHKPKSLAASTKATSPRILPGLWSKSNKTTNPFRVRVLTRTPLLNL